MRTRRDVESPTTPPQLRLHRARSIKQPAADAAADQRVAERLQSRRAVMVPPTPACIICESAPPKDGAGSGRARERERSVWCLVVTCGCCLQTNYTILLRHHHHPQITRLHIRPIAHITPIVRIVIPQPLLGFLSGVGASTGWLLDRRRIRVPIPWRSQLSEHPRRLTTR